MAEDVTLGLGGILGESTSLKPINDRPFTKAAQAELTLGLTQKKEEARLAAEKAKMDREYMNMIKPISTGDKIADENITKGYIDLVTTGNFRNSLAVKKFQDMSAFQKQAVEDERKWKSNIDKISLEPEVEEAFRKNDQAKLKGMLEIPTANVGYDPETQRFYPKQIFNKMDLNKVTPAVLNFDSQTPLNQSDWKVATDPNGHKYASVSVDPQVKEAKLNELINDKDYRENFRIKYKDKINIEMINSKVDLPTAIKTVMTKELDPYFRVQKDIKDVPKKSSGLNFNFGGGGGLIASNGIEMKADPNDSGLINVRKIVQPGKDTEVLSAILLDKNGEPHNFGKIEAYRKIGKDNYRVIGSTTESGTAIAKAIPNITGEQLAKSVGMKKEDLDKYPVTFEYDKEVEARNKAFAVYVKKYPKTPNRSGVLVKTTQESYFGDPEVTKYIAYKPNATPKANAAPAAKTTAKLSYPEWKKSNPNGSPADYKKYKK